MFCNSPVVLGGIASSTSIMEMCLNKCVSDKQEAYGKGLSTHLKSNLDSGYIRYQSFAVMLEINANYHHWQVNLSNSSAVTPIFNLTQLPNTPFVLLKPPPVDQNRNKPCMPGEVFCVPLLLCDHSPPPLSLKRRVICNLSNFQLSLNVVKKSNFFHLCPSHNLICSLFSIFNSTVVLLECRYDLGELER